jgi:hypothetical protein
MSTTAGQSEEQCVGVHPVYENQPHYFLFFLSVLCERAEAGMLFTLAGVLTIVFKIELAIFPTFAEVFSFLAILSTYRLNSTIRIA